jgi:hypothetical protein
MTQTKEAAAPSKVIDAPGDHLATVTREILRAIKTLDYGSVEIVVRNSRVVQIERKEKFRFD